MGSFLETYNDPKVLWLVLPGEICLTSYNDPYFFGDFQFADIVVNLVIAGPAFSVFNPCPSLPSQRGNRRQETVSMIEYSLKYQNRTIIFGI